MSLYVIGDLQGCLSALKRLLSHIRWDPHQDTLWFCGDLFNRGPQPIESFHFLRSLPTSTRFVLGNHDVALLATYSGAFADAWQNPELSVRHTQVAFLSDLDPKIWVDWLRHLPLLHSDQELLLVHAGIHPFWTLDQAQEEARGLEKKLQGPSYQEALRTWFDSSLSPQDVPQRFALDVFTRMRYCSPEGALNLEHKKYPLPTRAELEPSRWAPWFSYPAQLPASYRVLFGHWSDLKGICAVENREALDTGCVWGGQLTAWRFEDQQRFSVDNLVN